MDSRDTIVAISTSVGPAARIVVRTTGSQSVEFARRLGVPADAAGGSAVRCRISFSSLLVLAWAYLFRAPHSYTGEDLVEFHLPGSPVLARMLLDELLRAGCRLAGPGEFTARAYFNGRIDLTAAEGVAATIAATGAQELAAARQLLAGELGRRLAPAMDLLADTLALLEVGIDFSEEDVTFLDAAQVQARVCSVDGMLSSLLADSARFERLAHEPSAVLVGRPNAGKSTLLNALAGRERAVVSATAGTTRDALAADVTLRRGIVRVIDVAGIDEADAAAGDEVARKMRSQTLREVEAADVLVLVEDPSDPSPRLTAAREPSLVVRTKRDLSPHEMRGESRDQEIRVSALTGTGMDALRDRLDDLCFGDAAPGSTLALNRRHVQAIEEARAALRRVEGQLPAGRAELLALELREAIDALGGVLGRVTPDDLLGRIFAGFCIGK